MTTTNQTIEMMAEALNAQIDSTLHPIVSAQVARLMALPDTAHVLGIPHPLGFLNADHCTPAFSFVGDDLTTDPKREVSHKPVPLTQATLFHKDGEADRFTLTDADLNTGDIIEMPDAKIMAMQNLATQVLQAAALLTAKAA